MTPKQMCHAMLDDVFKNGTSVMKITRVDINAEFDQIGEAMNVCARTIRNREKEAMAELRAMALRDTA